MKKITQQVKTGAADLRRIRKQSSERPKLAIESTASKEDMEAFSHHLWKEGKTDEMETITRWLEEMETSFNNIFAYQNSRNQPVVSVTVFKKQELKH